MASLPPAANAGAARPVHPEYLVVGTIEPKTAKSGKTPELIEVPRVAASGSR